MMRLLEWLSARSQGDQMPRAYEQIKADLERKEAPNLARANKVEQSLLALTAEAGLDDLRHRLETRRA